MGLIKFLTGLAFASLFAIAIISFTIGYGQENDAVIGLNADGKISDLNQTLQTNLNEFEDDASDSSEILYASNIKSGDDNVEGGGQFKTGPTEVLTSAKTIVRVVNDSLFQGNGILATTFVAFLVLISGLYVWKVWKGGNPD